MNYKLFKIRQQTNALVCLRSFAMAFAFVLLCAAQAFAQDNTDEDVLEAFKTKIAEIMSSDTDLHQAALEDKADEVRALINAGADINANANELEITPLHGAATFGKLEAIKVLINAGADIEARNKNDETPLHFAACTGGAGVTKVLINAGADINARNNDGKRPFDVAHKSLKNTDVYRPLNQGNSP